MKHPAIDRHCILELDGCPHAILDDEALIRDAILAERVRGELRMLDGRAVRGLFKPPKYLRQAAVSDVPPITLEDAADDARDVLGD